RAAQQRLDAVARDAGFEDLSRPSARPCTPTHKQPSMNAIFLRFVFVSLVCAGSSVLAQRDAATWSVPLAGNAFVTAPGPSDLSVESSGTIALRDAETVYSVFFHADRPGELRLSINALAKKGKATVEVRVADDLFRTLIRGSKLKLHEIGPIEVAEAGYLRVDLRRADERDEVAELLELVVSSDTEGLELAYVRDNEGSMYYWGRRGPSVHLRYEVPQERPLRHAYTEITVPEGQDPVGSYFMANGFGEGYFGIQVNSDTERRVLFSVWSPYKTDDPGDIPEDQRIAVLGSGPQVHIGEFGNEGSGGQSYLIYPWRAGVTYRFLTEVQPDGEGNTIYTSWFADKSADEWWLIASFRRPDTDTYLRGFHSFLESFSPTFGHIGRRAAYGNVWVRDVEGDWHECTEARLSVDGTGSGRHRLDFNGGSDGSSFFMGNCGFVNETGRPGETFTRESTADDRPVVDFESLPRGSARR
ncbi:MAG: hypothetical protein ACI9EF_002106, partial [Pseudohongiellaceae bacterium]